MYYSTIQYSTVQCSGLQYSTVWYSTVQCSRIQYSTVQCSMQYSTIQYSTVQCNTVQYSMVQCSTVQQYSTVQCNTVQYSTVCRTLFYLSFYPSCFVLVYTKHQLHKLTNTYMYIHVHVPYYYSDWCPLLLIFHHRWSLAYSLTRGTHCIF